MCVGYVRGWSTLIVLVFSYLYIIKFIDIDIITYCHLIHNELLFMSYNTIDMDECMRYDILMEHILLRQDSIQHIC